MKKKWLSGFKRNLIIHLPILSNGYFFSPAELQEAFMAESDATGKPRLLLTAAVPVGPDNIKGGYDVPQVSKWVRVSRRVGGID